MTYPSEEYVKSAVEAAVQELLIKDEVLFRRGVAEWSVAHRLGVYLEGHFSDFPEFVIDCEFNRQPFVEEGSEFSSSQTKKISGSTRRPDIIAHKRADPVIEYEGDNLLAIELKVNKGENGDVENIENIIEEKDYEFGVFIDLYNNPTTQPEWDSSFLEWRPE